VPGASTTLPGVSAPNGIPPSPSAAAQSTILSAPKPDAQPSGLRRNAEDAGTEEPTLLMPSPVDASAAAQSVQSVPADPLTIDAFEDKSLTASSLLNLNLGSSVLDPNDEKRRRQISAALVREAASICAALENAVLYSKQQTKLRELKIDRLYVTGGASKLKGLIEFMSRRMRMEVLPLEPFKQLSLSRLPAEQAAALKAEQHTMSVAIGLAAADLQKGAFSFLLWPESVTERKVFWTRGAYLYYAAALIALGVGLFLYTPYRNAQALADNTTIVQDKTLDGQRAKHELEEIQKANEEKRQQLEQIRNNTLSGDKFLNILAELKNTNVIGNDIYIIQLTTKVPNVILKVGGVEIPEQSTTEARPSAPDRNQNVEPETFQAQRKVYIRGFARAEDKMTLINRVEEFKRRLVPNPDPSHPDNWLFKDIRTVWMHKDDQEITSKGQKPVFVKEFVLEAYTEAPKKEIKAQKVRPTPLAPQATTANPAPPAQVAIPRVEIAPPQAVQPIQPVQAIPVQPNPAQPRPQPMQLQPQPAQLQPQPKIVQPNKTDAPPADQKPAKKTWVQPTQ